MSASSLQGEHPTPTRERPVFVSPLLPLAHGAHASPQTVIVARVCLLARLKWDLDGKRPLEFGSLISSSNWMVDERIAVETDAPLLWTTGLHQRSKDTK